MTITALQELIAQGENTNVEFKSAKIRPETLAREIDKLGRGLPMVWQEAAKLGSEVQFLEQGEEFRVTLPLV